MIGGSPDDVLRDLQLAVSGGRNTAGRRETPDSLTAEWTFIPGWAIVVAVLAFPLGLIALVARKTVTGTVVVEPDSPDVSLIVPGACVRCSLRMLC